MRVWRTLQIGCGGIGGPFAMMASKVLHWHAQADTLYHLIDGDEYESGNLSRQFVYKGAYVKKVLSLHDLLTALGHSSSSLVMVDKFIENDEHFAGMLAAQSNGHDDEWQVVALCVDNDATRNMVYTAIPQTAVNVLVIDMANELHHGDVITYCRERRGMYATTHPFEIFPQLKKPKDRPPQAYCEEEAPNHPQLVTTNQMAAVIGARILWNFLEEEKVPSHVTFDMSKLRMRWEV